MITARRSAKRTLVAVTAFCLVLFWYHGFLHEWRSELVDFHGISYRTPSFDWAKLKLAYPQAKLRQLPQGEPRELPKVQHDFSASELADGAETAELRKQSVVQAFKRSWATYKQYAWGYDELMPISKKGKNTFGGYGASLVDALGTLWIMGMKEEFDEAVRQVALIDWNNTTLISVNMFETTIRYLGGILSAYDLSGEPVLLAKAVELGEMLYFGFDTANHMPPFWLKFADAKYGSQAASDHDPSTSGGSLSMEFTRLSQITGDPKWYDATERVKEFLHDTQQKTKVPGMWPAFLDYRRERANDGAFTIGAQADSVYEYLPKMHALLGGLDPQYPAMAEEALDTISANLLFRPMTPDDADILFAGDGRGHFDGPVALTPDMQHLSCFAGGMYGLAARLLSRPDFLETGERLTRGCVWAYAAMPTGLMPEISTLIPCTSVLAASSSDDDEGKQTSPDPVDNHTPCKWSEEKWNEVAGSRKSGKSELPKGFRSIRDSGYFLRPEAVESVFYMWRLTGDDYWRQSAWNMFVAIIGATETPSAYSAIRNVNVPPEEASQSDYMESFWFSETLRYLYLTFADPGDFSLDEWVLNTEAHPLKRLLPKREQNNEMKQ